jgi:hypothetical protein
MLSNSSLRSRDYFRCRSRDYRPASEATPLHIGSVPGYGDTWLSAALPYLGGGFFGAAFHLCRDVPARASPLSRRVPGAQRQAIGDIVAATHAEIARGRR